MSGPTSGSVLAGHRARVVAILVTTVVVLAAAGLSLARAGEDPRLMVRASFDDASPLLEGNDVRLGGVKVGEVASITIVDRSAEVLIELDETALPVYQDARLTIRPVSLLGERYVELDRGTPEAAELADGAALPVESTGSSTDLDEVLDVVDEPTGEALALLVGTLGTGMNGTGADVDAAVQALAPALSETGELTSVLAEQNATLGTLVTSLEQVAGGLATGEGQQLEQLVASADTLLATTQANEQAFRAMLAQLPGTLQSARTALQTLEGTAAATTPTLAELRPVTDDLTEVSSEILAFADAANPALGSLNGVLSHADELLAEAAPVAAALRAAAPALTADAQALDPLTRELAGDFTTVMEFFKGWALATNGRDGLAHYFRAGLVVTDYSVTGLLPTGGGAPAPTPAPTPTPGAAPLAPVPGVPDLLGGLGQGLDGITSGLAGLLSPQRTSDGGVTGLDATQERGVLGFLLGGN